MYWRPGVEMRLSASRSDGLLALIAGTGLYLVRQLVDTLTGIRL